MKSMIPVEVIEKKIFLIRGQKVMLDRDIAEMYGVETKRLNEQVRRNTKRFPEDFMFQLSKEEFENWRSQIATSNSDKMGLRRRPYAFTENGVAMLSSVLTSDRAIEVNIQIMRTFTRLKTLALENNELKAIFFIAFRNLLLYFNKYLMTYERETIRRYLFNAHF